MIRARRGQFPALALALGLACGGVFGCSSAPPEAVRPKPVLVTYASPVSDYVTDYEDFTGRTEAIFSINITARVSGYLDKVHFKDGDEVKEDDPLFDIDPRPYKAELDRTEANLAQTEAHLKRLEADFRRATNLLSRGSIGREEYDKVSGDRAEAEAAVGIARASFDLAKLNVGFTKINAPITGRLSRRMVDPGNLVKSDETALTTIISQDPLYVYFDVDERTLLRLRRLVGEGKIPSRQVADIPVLCGLSDEEDFPHKGLVNFSDNKVDPGTGTLRVRASLANPKPRLLSPGMFMRVRLPVGSPRKSTMVPERSLMTDQGQKYLYLVDEHSKVLRRDVSVGKLEGRMRVIEKVDKGLPSDAKVIVEGQQRVRPGAEVTARPEPGSDDLKTKSTAERPPSAPEKRG
jgi:RND family efflux transporter MFP subunit